MTTETQAAPTAETKAPKTLCGYMPVANLYQAAHEALAEWDAWDETIDIAALTAAMTKLRTALEGIEEAKAEAEALYDSVTANVGQVGDQDGDVDIIGDWTHHNGSEPGDGGGYWVDAWVWVEDDSEPDYEAIARAAGFIVEANVPTSNSEPTEFTWLRADRSDEAETLTREQQPTEEEAWEACCEANNLA